MDFSKLKEYRKAAKLTQMDLARALGVSVWTCRVWEYGGGKPNKENLEKLKKVLGVKG